jgi:hypothetical protein
MPPIFKGQTSKDVAAECGCHAEIVSDGARAVLSLLDLKSKVWSMAIIDPAKDLVSDSACEVFAIRAARQPEVHGAVTEDSNEAQFERCLDLEDELKGVPVTELDIDEEPDDDDNSYL